MKDTKIKKPAERRRAHLILKVWRNQPSLPSCFHDFQLNRLQSNLFNVFAFSVFFCRALRRHAQGYCFSAVARTNLQASLTAANMLR